PGAVLLTAIIAAAIGAATVAVRGVFALAITFAAGGLAHIMASKVIDANGVFMPEGVTNLYFMMGCGFLLYALVIVFTRSNPGLQLSDVVARAFVPASSADPGYRERLVAFTISGAVCGFAGALYATTFQFLDPSIFSIHFSLGFLAIALIGGSRFVSGAVIGAVLLVPMYLASGNYLGEAFFELVVVPVIIVIALLFYVGPRKLLSAVKRGQ